MMKLLSLVLFSLALGCAAPVVALDDHNEHDNKPFAKGKGHGKGFKKTKKERKKLTPEEIAAKKAARAARAARAASKAAEKKD